MKKSTARIQISNFMQALMDFEAYIVENDFVEIFGNDCATAMWLDFKGKCAGSTTIFYRTLDMKDRQKFDEFLAKSHWFNKTNA